MLLLVTEIPLWSDFPVWISRHLISCRVKFNLFDHVWSCLVPAQPKACRRVAFKRSVHNSWQSNILMQLTKRTKWQKINNKNCCQWIPLSTNDTRLFFFQWSKASYIITISAKSRTCTMGSMHSLQNASQLISDWPVSSDLENFQFESQQRGNGPRKEPGHFSCSKSSKFNVQDTFLECHFSRIKPLS